MSLTKRIGESLKAYGDYRVDCGMARVKLLKEVSRAMLRALPKGLLREIGDSYCDGVAIGEVAFKQLRKEIQKNGPRFFDIERISYRYGAISPLVWAELHQAYEKGRAAGEKMAVEAQAAINRARFQILDGGETPKKEAN